MGGGSGSGSFGSLEGPGGGFRGAGGGAATRYLGKFGQVNPVAAPGSVAATSLGAATPDHGRIPAVLILAVVVALWAGGYLLACWIWPYRACPTCEGSGKRRSPSGKAWRRCRRCKGTGARLRIGRRVYNFLATRHGGDDS